MSSDRNAVIRAPSKVPSPTIVPSIILTMSPNISRGDSWELPAANGLSDAILNGLSEEEDCRVELGVALPDPAPPWTNFSKSVIFDPVPLATAAGSEFAVKLFV